MVREEMNAEKEEVLNEMQNDEESVDIQNLGANDKGRNGECAEKSIDEGGSDLDAKDALSKLLQMGTVAEDQNAFEILIN
ncbi:hypothetical protein Tco_1024227 [Tanacetum coccineum]